MKACVLFNKHDLKVTDFPIPEFNENTVMIKVKYCGICGTDIHKYEGKAGSRPVKYPVPLGHEVSGIVEKVGSKVNKFKVGDRVTVDPNYSCGNCWYCQNNKKHLCQNSKGVVKGMAEYICPPQENVYKIPDTLSLIDASLTEPVSCCIHGIDLLDVKLGDTVAIIGLGAIGQLMLQLLSHNAAGNIIVIETNEAKREIAYKLGATLFINPNSEDINECIKKANIENIQKVIECVGIIPTAITAINIASKGATVVLFGVFDQDNVLPIKPSDLFNKELTIKSSYINPYTMQRAINLLDNKAIDTSYAISKIISLDELPEEINTRTNIKQGKVIVEIK